MESGETKLSWCGFRCLLGSTVKIYSEMETKERASEREYIYLGITFYLSGHSWEWIALPRVSMSTAHNTYVHLHVPVAQPFLNVTSHILLRCSPARSLVAASKLPAIQLVCCPLLQCKYQLSHMTQAKGPALFAQPGGGGLLSTNRRFGYNKVHRRMQQHLPESYLCIPGPAISMHAIGWC